LVSTSLHTLVHSLTKSEKIYFKKYTHLHGSEENSNYLRLFKLIDRQKKYNEEQIKKVFKNEKFTRQLHVTKKYLYKLILKSMRNYYWEISTGTKIKGRITDIHYLTGKRMYPEALKELRKTKKQATDHEKYIDLMTIFDMEKMLIRMTNPKNQVESLAVIHDEEIGILKQIKIEKELEWLYKKLTSLIRTDNITDKGQKNFDILVKIMDDAESVTRDRDLSNKSRILYYQLNVAYNFSIPDDSGAYVYSKKLVGIFERAPELIIEEPRSYIISSLNLIELNLKLGQYGLFRRNLNRLKYMPLKLLKKLSDLNMNFMRISILIEEITYYKKTGNFRKGDLLIKENSAYINNEAHKADPVLRCMLYLNISILYFEAGHYSDSLDWLNKFLNDKTMRLVKNHYESARYFSLFIHFELGSYELLRSIISSEQKHMKDANEMGKIILFFFRELIDSDPDSEYTYVKFRKKILSFYSDARIDGSKMAFDILSWIDLKLEKLKK
jgi:hypothetical protein